MTDMSNVTEFAANASMPLRQREAPERPITIAQGGTGQNRKVAGFLLVWWNAGENGGFNLINLWSVDAGNAHDMVEVFNLVASSCSYPDAFGYRSQLEASWQRRRKAPTE